MAELQDGTLDFEARLTLVSSDVRKLQEQLSEIGKSGERAGNNIDRALVDAFSNMTAALGNSTTAVTGQLGTLVDVTRDSTNEIQQQLQLIHERLNAAMDTRVPTESFQKIEEGAEEASEVIDTGLTPMIEKASRALAALGVGFSLQQIVTQVARTRGEFQQLEVAFETMLGSEVKAATLMNQLTETAAHTPFDLKGIADGAKQLLAYGFAAEDVNDTLVMLGNVASGLSIPLNDIVYLYGTTMTQGRVFTQDLRQFMGRGIPLAEELAKQFGVTKDKVGELVTDGKVGFNEVAKAMRAMTSEGGQFYNLMDKQSQTINGLVSNLQDAIDTMMNDIGKQTQDTFSTVLRLGISAVENYKGVGRALAELVAVIGTYKGIMMAVNLLQRAQNKLLSEAAVIKELNAVAGYKMGDAEAKAAAKTALLTAAQRNLTAALKASALANPYVILAASVTALGFAVYKVVTYQTQMEKIQNDIAKASQQAASNAEAEIAKLNELRGALSACAEESDEYNAIRNQIVESFAQYDATLTNETTSVSSLAEKYDDLTLAIQKSFAIRAFNESYEKAQTELADTYTKQLEKLKKQMISAFGEETGAEIHQSLVNAIREGDATAEITTWGNKLTARVKGVSDDINELLRGKYASLTGNKLFGFAATDFVALINNLNNTSEAMKNLRKETMLTYGLNEEDFKPQTKTETPNPDTPTPQEENEEARKRAEERKKRIKQYNAEIIEATAQAELELAQAQIDAMDDGEEKTERQLDLNLQKRLRVIEQQRRKWEEANKELFGSLELTPEQQKAIEAMYEAAHMEFDTNVAEEGRKENEQLNKALQDRLKLWQTFVDKQNAIVEEYDERRKQIEENRNLTEQERDEQLTATNRQQQYDTDILMAQLGITDEEVANELTEIILHAYHLATDNAVEAIQTELLEVTTRLNEITQDGVTVDEEEQVRQLEARQQSLIKAEQKAKQGADKLAAAANKGGITIKDKMGMAVNAMNTLNEAVNEVRDTFGEFFSENTNNALDMVQTILSSTTGVLDTLRATGIASAEALSTAEKSTVILAIIQAAIQVTMAMVRFFSNFTKNARLQDQIDAFAEDVERLEDAYEKAVFSHRKLVGGSYFRQSIRDTDALKEALKDVQEEIRLTQMQLENAVTKKGRKRYEENLRDLEEQARNLTEKIEGIYDNFYENVLATSSADFASSLTDSLVEAFDAGMKDMSSVFDDAMNDMLRSLISTQMKMELQELYDPIIEQFRNRFSSGRTEVTQADIDAFVRDIESAQSAGEQIAEGWRTLYNAIGLNTGDLAASTNALQGMTQDTAEELNGRFTALQMSGASIDLKMDRIQTTIQQISGINSGIAESIALSVGIANDQLNVLEDIRNNTRELASIRSHLSRIESQMAIVTGE